jgi:hypothetical protein
MKMRLPRGCKQRICATPLTILVLGDDAFIAILLLVPATFLLPATMLLPGLLGVLAASFVMRVWQLCRGDQESATK